MECVEYHSIGELLQKLENMRNKKQKLSDYPDNWKEIALEVKKRAGFRCEICGAESSFGHILTVHHKDGNPANNDPENLIALCQRCHLSVQGSGRRARRYNPNQQKLFSS